MNYEEFKKNFEEDFVDAMGGDYRGYEFLTFPVTKNGRHLDGFSVIRDESDTLKPTLYFNDFYDMYEHCGNYQKTLSYAVSVMVNGFKNKKNISSRLNFDDIDTRIVFQLINTSDNEKMLDNIPHRDFYDMSVIYRWAINVDSEGITSAVIDNELCNMIGMNEESLFESAMENSIRILPPDLITMDKLISESYEYMDDLPIRYEDLNTQAFILTNRCKLLGASLLLYDDLIGDIADKYEADFFVIPSSVNEVYLLKASDMINPRGLYKTHSIMNIKEQADNSKLSDMLFYYSRESKRLFSLWYES